MAYLDLIRALRKAAPNTAKAGTIRLNPLRKADLRDRIIAARAHALACMGEPRS